MSKRTSVSTLRCKGTNKRGEPCQASIVGADGRCAAHSGLVDMKAIGRKGGKSRRQGVAEQLPEGERESLSEALRRGLDHEDIVAAVKQSLAGGSESARVAAVRFLSDLETYRKGDDCPRCAARSKAAPYAWANIEQLLSMQITSVVKDEFGLHESARVRGLVRKDRQKDHEGEAPVTAMVRRAVRRACEGRGDELDVLVDKILNAAADGLQVAVPDPEREAATFAALEEMGFVAGRGKIEERAEEIAQERLAALKAEHGVPV